MSGCFCSIGIAIHKDAYTKHLLTNEIPSLIKHLQGRPREDALYWRFDDLEWSTARIELEAFFNLLATESPVDMYVLQPGQVHVPLYSKACFGAIRIGESETDYEEWGSPKDYGLSYERSIEVPCF